MLSHWATSLVSCLVEQAKRFYITPRLDRNEASVFVHGAIAVRDFLCSYNAVKFQHFALDVDNSSSTTAPYPAGAARRFASSGNTDWLSASVWTSISSPILFLDFNILMAKEIKIFEIACRVGLQIIARFFHLT
jgi:hypothetical protein